MSTVLQKINEIGKGRSFTLNKSDYIFQRVSFTNSQFVVYEISSKAKPFYTITEDKNEEEFKHSGVIRVTKIPNEDNQIKALLDLSEMRIEMQNDECPDLIKFYDQGLTKYGDDIYHLIRYDDPIRTFDHYINIDHKTVEIDYLDCFRLLRGVLSAFVYLQENGYVLTQFDDKNLYVGSFSEDRECFFKIMFKGHRNHNTEITSLHKRNLFSPPETETPDIYKSFSFSAGLMVLYAIFATHGKNEEFPNIKKDVEHIHDYINKASLLLYNEKEKSLMKMFVDLFHVLLEPKVEARLNAKLLLKYPYFAELDKLDYAEYLKEIEENEKAKLKPKEKED